MYQYKVYGCIFLPDGVVSMMRTVYTVSEDKGHITLCAMVVNESRCPIDFEFSFVMSTQMGMAGIYVPIQSCVYAQSPLSLTSLSLSFSFSIG